MVLRCKHGHDTQCGRMLAVCGLGSRLLTWLLSQLVTWWNRLSWLSFLALLAISERAFVPFLFTGLAQLHAHVAGNRCGQSVVLAHFAQLFSHFSFVQSNLAILLAHIPELFTDQSALFTDLTVVLANIAFVQSDIAELFTNLT